jgi:glyoxylate reductase
MTPSIFVTVPIPGAMLERLREQCRVAVNSEDTDLTTPELQARISDVDGLMVANERISRQVLDAAPRLRAVAKLGAGYDTIDVAACTERRIVVTNTGGESAEATADWTFALLLALARRVVGADRYVRDGNWKRSQRAVSWGTDVHRKTLGIYGFGNIGRAVARRGHGFSMRVIYCSRRRAPVEIERELAAEQVGHEALVRESDFLCLHVPLTRETDQLIGNRELSMMKSTAFLINTARGRVVDEAGLVEALASGKIAGAALDVFEREPEVHAKLLTLPNVLLAPHIGSCTSETRLRMAELAVENLLTALAGRRPPDLVNPEAYSVAASSKRDPPVG